jgi:hypothetical protein
LQHFDALVESGLVISTHQISFSNRTISIKVAAGATEDALMPALAHLLVDNSREADLEVCAWDSQSTGAPRLSPEWTVADYRPHGYISGFNDDRFHTIMQLDPVVLHMFDAQRRRALYWTPSASQIPSGERGAPLRPLLHAWMGKIGLVGVHGGAVGRADGGVFIPGASGRGKSNVSLSCLNSELFYAADDLCALSNSAGWKVHSLYCSGKIISGDLARHPLLSGTEINPERPDHEKAVFFLNERFGHRLIREMPLRAIVLPRVVAAGPSTIALLPPAAAQSAVAMSAIGFSRWPDRSGLLKIARLHQDIPCYELQVGASIEQVPPLLTKLLNDLQAQESAPLSIQ